MSRAVFLPFLLITVILHAKSFQEDSAILSESQELIADFFHRYNATKKVDLVFIVDRSGSVPKRGWDSMLNFVTNLLEHFTVDPDNTRVAIVTFSTHYTVNYNGLNSLRENKCALYHQIRTYIEKIQPYGYTALYDALQAARGLLVNSRPNSKKAVFVLTDGNSNVGPPPVKAAHDILSLEWSTNWSEDDYGPQVEIYAIGIHDAKLSELESIVYPPKNHTFLIPDFTLFNNLARSLHGDLQEETWTLAADFACHQRCGKNAQCTCGTGTGEYECICKPGYEWNGEKCTACKLGHFKPDLAPTRCIRCSANSTTIGRAASSCGCFPPYFQAYPGAPCTLTTCPDLPVPESGYKYHVAGSTLTEVANTHAPCCNTAHNSCHFGCHRGYRLDSFPALVCHENGSWSGEPPNCEIVDCGTIEDPSTDGQIIYVNGSTTYGSILRVVCRPGQMIFGDGDRTCGEHARWSGTVAKCIDIECLPLPTISYTWTAPHSCTQIRQPYGSQCAITCRDGFQPSPKREARRDDSNSWVKTCGEDGQWTGQNFVCEDTQPPTITCPDDVITYADHGQNTSIVHWQNNKPVIRDNSYNYTYHVNGQLSNLFLVGLHVLQYVVTDSAGNQAQCSRKINVIGRRAKVIFCPQNITLTNITNQSAKVHWADPIFHDQDNRSLMYSCTRESGDRFSVGVHHVHCYPDRFPDVICKFAVNISAKSCEKLPKPKNGVAVCINSVQYLLQCNIKCNDQYEFAYPPSDFYYCDVNGNWVEKWPHCSRVYRSGRTRLRGEVQYHYYGGSCRDASVKEHIRKMSWQKLTSYSSSICTRPDIKCNLKDVQVHCYGDAGSQPESTTNEPVTDETDGADTQGHGSNAEGQRLYFNGYRHYRARRSVGHADVDGSHQEQDSGTEKRALRENVTFSVEFSIEAEAEVGLTVTKTMQTDLMYRLLDIEYEVDKGGLGINTSGNLLAESRMDMSVAFVTNCTVGQILVSEDYSARCVNCPVGSYHNGVDCELCPVGFFQDEEASTKCNQCPDDKTTVKTGSIKFEDCSDPCEPGTYSVTGLQPCDPCELGTYQENSGTKECNRCPPGTGTHGVRTIFSYECTDECSPGHFNTASGLEQCTPCPRNSYQPDSAARVCHSCPDLKETWATGESNSLSCIDIDHCEEDVCLHGNCIDGKGGYSCECEAGWTGDDCDENINECVSSPCQHGALCVDGLNGYTCLCQSGYTGEHCDIEEDECQSNPCLNGGSCVDAIDGYTCYCRTGYSGSNCDVDLDSCTKDICRHGNCTDLVDGFRCECFPGFTGPRCEAVLNPCIGDPCKNDATCTSTGTSYECHCPEGYAGRECEVTIDECESRPCLNGGTCDDGVADYHCRCVEHFAGKNCEIEYGREFDLVFKEPSITDYAAVTITSKKLTAITVAFWMRSHDQLNYGTPFSYGAESNWLGFESSNMFTLYNYGEKLFINGEEARLGLRLNNGHWNHVCISWEGTLGRWRAHVNGTLVSQGTAASNTHIEGGGSFVLGQEQDSIGGSFNRRESFIGELSQVQVFDYILSEAELFNISSKIRCMSHPGNVLSWSDFPQGVKGKMVLRTETYCLDVNECVYHDVYHCDGNHACEDLIGSYTCGGCHPGWTGDQCDMPIDECASSPCLNNGTCVDDTGLDDWRCICPAGFLGRDCFHEIDPCGSMPCLNNGTCIQVDSGYKCLCPVSTVGDFCQKNYKSCSENPCANNATCLMSNGSYYCVCPVGYRGQLCEERINFCESFPCSNGGTCLSYLTDFECRCVAPWVGKHCTTSYKPNCNHFPCLNNGTCVLSDEQDNGYSCICPNVPNTTWGPNCEIPTICNTNPCKHGGTCVHLNQTHYDCLCPEIYLGKNCEKINPMYASVTSTPDHISLKSSSSSTPYADIDSTSPSHRQTQTIASTTLDLSTKSPSPTTEATPSLSPFPSMRSTAALTPTATIPMTSGQGDVQPTSTPSTPAVPVTIPTSVIRNGSGIDLCGMEACHNGGSCKFDGNNTRCVCPDDFKGDYCDMARKKVNESYHVTVTLLMEYSDSLKDSKAFSAKFKKAIQKVYMPLMKKGTSKISIHINDIRAGSVVVDFTLQHVQYEDEPAITKDDMMDILQEELKTGKLGDMSASEQFGFDVLITKMPAPDEDRRKVYVLAGIIVGCVICGIVCLVIVIAVVRNRRQEVATPSAKSKTYRKPFHGDVVITSISNAAFEPDPGDDLDVGPEDHVYADIDYEPMPYAITTRADLERNNSFLNRMSHSHPLRGVIDQEKGPPQSASKMEETDGNDNSGEDGQDNQAYEDDYLEPIISTSKDKPRLPNTGFCTYEFPSEISNLDKNLAIERKPSSSGESSVSNNTASTPDDSYENLVSPIIVSPRGHSLSTGSRKSDSSGSLKESSESLTSPRKTSSRDSLKRSLESLRNIGRTSPKIKLKRNQNGRENAVFEVSDILLPIFEETRQELAQSAKNKDLGVKDITSGIKSKTLGAGLPRNGNYMGILPLKTVIPTLELPKFPPPEFNPKTRSLPQLPYRQEEERILRLHEKERLQREYF